MNKDGAVNELVSAGIEHIEPGSTNRCRRPRAHEPAVGPCFQRRGQNAGREVGLSRHAASYLPLTQSCRAGRPLCRHTGGTLCFLPASVEAALDAARGTMKTIRRTLAIGLVLLGYGALAHGGIVISSGQTPVFGRQTAYREWSVYTDPVGPGQSSSTSTNCDVRSMVFHDGSLYVGSTSTVGAADPRDTSRA